MTATLLNSFEAKSLDFEIRRYPFPDPIPQNVQGPWWPGGKVLASEQEGSKPKRSSVYVGLVLLKSGVQGSKTLPFMRYGSLEAGYG
ncbi:hypothetical protein AVEN_165400-1 [Araneus ventricosus]|uniref:Uncharacterized protein n=1 Tax=Araneus ventricosus TaxID=182803 RepID=A0A4Y2AU10_ARAVE|nr:hypothetical protein AVEN_165400-1 [Araneus ventricosus]